ncbi:hypothetical protein JCM6882_009764 [Rhodosporidiobolus microsporus]
MPSHLRTRSLSSRHLVVPPPSASSSSSSSPSPSPLLPASHARLPSFSPRRIKALLQFLVALSATASLLVYLANSSPTGFSNSATAPAANAAVDAFLRLKPRPAAAPTPVRAAVNETAEQEEPPPPLRPSVDPLAPLARPSRVSNSAPWVLSKPADQLPPCDKILLFTFMPWWGFASEYILYVRAAAAAKRLGYTLVEDDRNWNYGRLANYFSPRKLSCVPPSDWSDPRKAYPFHQGSHWAGRARLRYSRVVLSNLDDWTREEYLSSPASRAALRDLQRSDRRHRERGDRWILEEGGTLPGVFGEVFEDQAEVVRGLWRLKSTMREQVEEVKERTGLSKRKWEAGEEGSEEEKRGPVIALHVRLGDKASEYEHDSKEMGITNTFGNLTVYIEAAHDAYRRLIPSHYPPLSSSLTRPRFTPYARPSLLLITAEPALSTSLRRIPLAGPFALLETPPPDVRDESVDGGTKARLEEQQRAEGEAESAGKGGPKAYVAAAANGGGAGRAVEGAAATKMVKLAKGGAAAVEGGRKKKVKRGAAAGDSSSSSSPAAPAADLSSSGGYVQASFNALPLLERVVHTQAFVRDLTIIAREVDAAVVSGASNVGRLAMLIAGKDAVTGPTDENGRLLGGRIRSVDAHFYPTAYSSAVYAQIKDVEDTDHAAFVPEEQHAAEVRAAEEKRRRKKKEEEKEKGKEKAGGKGEGEGEGKRRR